MDGLATYTPLDKPELYDEMGARMAHHGYTAPAANAASAAER
ncbi:MAG: hypothetical protein ABSH24_10910 [Bryobacteraceae bacterium]